jgi:serine protease AprX
MSNSTTHHTGPAPRRRLATVLLAGTTGLAAIAAVSAAPLGGASVAAGSGTSLDVVVRAEAGHSAAAIRAFVALGGEVGTALPIIDGFSGTITDDVVDDLIAHAAVATVTSDIDLAPMSTPTAPVPPADPSLGPLAGDTGSLSAITRITGAQAMWDQGYAGQGIDVAVIDTGVSRVPGLDQPGKVLDGPDLSFDSLDAALVSNDAFGHGTHMASIIAGSDVAPGTSVRRCRTCTGRSAYTDTTKFVGIAPEARIINVKVGAFDGAADVSQVIAAIDWVVQHRNDPGVNIRVLNLSFGTDSMQDPTLDPLVFAAEQAWRAGIVVVASAGNDAANTSRLATPAVSSAILAVGASDPRGTLRTFDDVIPEFARYGAMPRGVDLVAPGVSVIGLRVPGGFIDTNVSTGRVGDRFQRASGTSQATAVVSGLAALLLSRHPDATPDMVKAYLTGNADRLRLRQPGMPRVTPDEHRAMSGAGSAFVGGSKRMRTVASIVPTGTGLGSLDASRGSYFVTNGEVELRGEIDIFGAAWDPATWTPLSSTGTAWTGGIWNGNRWTGDGWGETGWIDVTWTDSEETSADWTGVRWKGVRWKNVIWDGVRWKDASWTSAQWTSGGWSGVRWKGAPWSDASWS